MSTHHDIDSPIGDGRDLPDTDALQAQVQTLLERARSHGADAAEASLAASRALSVSARGRARESIEHEGDRSASVTVYCRQRSGSASTTDLSARGLSAALEQALTAARFTEADRYAGLADAADMARSWPELDLYRPWGLSPDAALEQALAIEAAALDFDTRIVQTEGATVVTRDGLAVYGNSHGFIGCERSSRHAASCSAIARDDQGMQREVAFTQARDATELDDAAHVGRRAAERALARLGASTPPTTRAPVLFTPRVARSLWGHVIGAISGGALYREASFLKGCIDQSIAAAHVSLSQHPHRPRGLASAGFDADGVATRERVLIEEGVLRGYVLGAYTARRLGLKTTGNAGGVFNLDVAPGREDLDSLVAGMGRGLVVTELMGQGVNLVNGDYSRGAAGYWVEDGAYAYPVENATIAGNLAAMLKGIKALGNDVEHQSALRSPSVLVGEMTIAGQ